MGALLLIFVLHGLWFVLAGALVIGGLISIVVGVLELVRRRPLRLPSRHVHYSASVPAEGPAEGADFEDREQWADARLLESTTGDIAAGPGHDGALAPGPSAPPRWRGSAMVLVGALAAAGGVILFVQTVANLTQ